MTPEQIQAQEYGTSVSKKEDVVPFTGYGAIYPVKRLLPGSYQNETGTHWLCPKCGTELKIDNRSGFLDITNIYDCPKCGYHEEEAV